MRHEFGRWATLLAAAVLIPGVASIDVSDASQRLVEPAHVVAEYGFDWDYSTWEFDRNQNRLDDRIEALAAHKDLSQLQNPDGFLPFFIDAIEGGFSYGLHVAMDQGIADGDLVAMQQLGLNPRTSELVPSIWVEAATAAQATAIAGLRGVDMVELAPKFKAFNTRASEAVRVRDSGTYASGVHEDLGYDGTGVGVAIMDTGTDDEHMYFQYGNQFVAGADSSYACYEAVEINPDDDNSVSVAIIGLGIQTFHGTHVAGTAVGAFGMAPDADLFEAKVLTAPGIGCLGSVAAGIEWIMNWNLGNTNAQKHLGAPTNKAIRVANLSLGSSCSNGSDGTSQWINILVNTGVTAVIAMGNDGLSNCVTSPAAAAKAIAVGAFNDQNSASRSGDSMASFSNCHLGSTKPDVAAPGVAIASARGHSVPRMATFVEQSLSGTSMATPVVSGVVALMLEANPDLAPDEVKQLLREAAEKKGSSMTPAKKDSCWGFGALDAYGAVKRAADIASGTVSSPATVSASGTASVTLSMDYTKTEFMNHGAGGAGSSGAEDEVEFDVTLPLGWSGTVSSHDADASGLLTASTTTGPGAHLLIDYDGDVDGGTSEIDDVEANPTVTMTLSAPATLGTYDLVAVFTTNGIAHEVPFTMTVV